MDKSKISEIDKLAESLGNVSLACARLGVTRSLYYKWKARLSGNRGGVTRRRRHPQATEEPVRERILEIALRHPEWGCDRISYYLKLQKDTVSGTTVQKILRAHGIGNKSERKDKAL